MENSWSNWLKDWWRLKKLKRRSSTDSGDSGSDYLDEIIEGGDSDECSCEECMNVRFQYLLCFYCFDLKIKLKVVILCLRS